jgi:hypothetical protein
MVAARPSFSVLLQSLLVLGEVVLLQMELFRSLFQGWNVGHGGALESLVRSELRLEV